jgi:hypothetical protein
MSGGGHGVATDGSQRHPLRIRMVWPVGCEAQSYFLGS